MPSRSRVSSTRRRMVSAGQAELLHPVGELLLDGVGDEAGGRVLADVPDQVRALARRGAHDAHAVEEHVAGQPATGEPRHQPVSTPSSVDLPEPVGPVDQHQLALADAQVDAVQDGAVAVVGQADPAQLDHAATSTRAGRALGQRGADRRRGGQPAGERDRHASSCTGTRTGQPSRGGYAASRACRDANDAEDAR